MGDSSMSDSLEQRLLEQTERLLRIQRESGANALFEKPLLPEPGETVAIAPATPKVASLIYDRVFGSPSSIPEELRFCPPLDDERYVALYLMPSLLKAIDSEQNPLITFDGTFMVRAIAEYCQVEYGIKAVSIYESLPAREAEYMKGDYKVLLSTLTNLQIVDEEVIEWDQVLEFKKDKTAQKKFRRLMHWLDGDMLGRSQDFIEEEIGNRLEGYSWSIKKHGLKTAIGTVSSLIDARSLVAAAGITASAAYAYGSVAAAVAVAGLVAGKLGIEVAKGLIDIEDARRGTNSEIAFVHQVQRKLAKRRKAASLLRKFFRS